MRQLYIYFTLIVLSFQIGFAQNPLEDSFQVYKEKYIKELDKYPNPDTNRAKTLYMITDKCTFLKHRKEVMPYFKESFALSKKLHYNKCLAKCYYWLGLYHKGAVEYEQAHLYFDSAAIFATKTKNMWAERLVGMAYRSKAMVYQQTEDYLQALEYYIKALGILEKNPDPYTIYIYRDISTIYTYLKNTAKAIEYAKLYAVKSEEKKELTTQIAAYSFEARTYLLQGKIAEASASLAKMQPYMPDTVELNITYSYYLHLGTIAALSNKRIPANDFLQQALFYAQKSNHGIAENAVLQELFYNSLQMKDLANAQKYAEKNLHIAQQVHNKLDQITALYNLSEYYREIKDFKQAYQHIERAMRLKDSLMEEDNIKQINRLEAIYQKDKKEKEILTLQKENEITEINNQNRKKVIGLLLIIIAILLLMGWLFYQYTQKKQEIQSQKIVELEKDKHILSIDAMLKGQEDERSRLAKDLHDGLGGMLSGVKLSLVNMKENSIMTPENQENFERAIQLMDSSIKELRHVAHNLMPEALVKLGLKEALSDFCSNLQASSHIKVIYQFMGSERFLGNTPNVYIYRIIQELVNNALKHAQAKEIIVQVVIDEQSVNITVEDDGIGFDTKMLQESKGMGLSNIQARVNYFQGMFDIHSAPNAGTSVNIIFNV